MRQLTIIILLINFFGNCLSQQTNCSLNLTCDDATDNSCQTELIKFKQCVSTNCDQQKIQSQEVQEIFECYYINCKPNYHPFLQEILNTFSCLNLSICESEEVEQEQEDGEINLEDFKEHLNKSSEGNCLAKMISDCQASSSECVTSFYIQLYCMSSQCNLQEDNTTINEISDCIQNTCQSSFDQLNNLNSQFYQCLQQLDQASSTSFGSYFGITVILTFFYLLF